MTIANNQLMKCLFRTFSLSPFLSRSLSFVNPVVSYNLKPRAVPEIMKLENSQYGFILSLQLTTVLQAFDKYKYEIRLCGGAVRDILMGKMPTDLDFATTATPDEMIEFLTKENIRMVNKGGLKHGTVTPHVDGVNFEITTLRIDVTTDGRHADVEYTTDWKLDAGRRDLTVNSMYLGMDGTVFDYFNGYEDLKKRQIKFVGDPKKRIAEDYLRILRYFRFYGRLADTPNKHDEHIIEAIRELGPGLKQISGERIWSELSKIIEGNYGLELLKTILSLDLGPYIGLPDRPNIDEFDKIMNQSKDLKLQPISKLVALLKDSEDMKKLNNRLKFSAYDRELGLYLIQHRNEKFTPKFFKIKILQSQNKNVIFKSYTEQLFMYQNERIHLEEMENWTPVKFPIKGSQLAEHGVTLGKHLGVVIKKLIEYWADDDFKTDVNGLLKLIPKAEKELRVENEKKFKN